MWFSVSCPRCALNVEANGVRACGACRALLIIEPSPRRKCIDTRAYGAAYRWVPDPDGMERINPRIIKADNSWESGNQHGRWELVRGILTLPRVDRRRAGRPEYPWMRSGRFAC